MQKFVIIAAARTGSTLLVQLLNSSPSVKCHYELFNRHELTVDGENRRDQIPARDADPAAFLDGIIAETRQKTDAQATGFKIFDGHNEDLLARLIRDSSCKKIVLNRRNFLSIYSSRLISQKKELWSAQTEDGKSGTVAQTSATHTWNDTVTFQEDEFWRLYRQHTGFYERVISALTAANQHFEYLEYGDLLNEGLTRRVFPYLGVDQPVALKTNMRRNNTPHIISRFDNRDEVREFLRGIGRLDWITESDSGWTLEG